MPWSWLDKVNYHYITAGENLAMDVNDPKVLINAWLASPSHAKNILNENFTDIGIGIAKGKINNRETIVVVMFLAREMTIIEEIIQEEEPQVLGLLIEEIKNTPPEDPIIIEIVKQNKSSYIQPGQNLVISQINKETNLNKTNFQVVRRFPEIVRLILSILYSILIFLAVFLIIMRKERDLGIVFNSIILLGLIYLMYLPDFL